jgi:hypothetical protein
MLHNVRLRFSSLEMGGDLSYAQLRLRTKEGQVLSFEVIPNEADGNCLYRALSQARSSERERLQAEFRRAVVLYVTSEPKWPVYYPHLRAQHEGLISIPEDDPAGAGSNSWSWKEGYREYMSRDGVYGTLQELLAASELLEFNLIVIRELSPGLFNVQTFKDQQTFPISHFFLFTGRPEAGHFELLLPLPVSP